MELKIKELAKKHAISVAQARELHEFPFKFLKPEYLKIDVTKDETTDLDFLYNNFMTIKINKKRLKRWKTRISQKNLKENLT